MKTQSKGDTTETIFPKKKKKEVTSVFFLSIFLDVNNSSGVGFLQHTGDGDREHRSHGPRDQELQIPPESGADHKGDY